MGRRPSEKVISTRQELVLSERTVQTADGAESYGEPPPDDALCGKD